MVRKSMWIYCVVLVTIALTSVTYAKTEESDVPRFLNDIAPILDQKGCSGCVMSR